MWRRPGDNVVRERLCTSSNGNALCRLEKDTLPSGVIRIMGRRRQCNVLPNRWSQAIPCFFVVFACLPVYPIL